MIKGIYIENFKGIGAPGIQLDLEPVTLLFGSNSAGKSTIFHAFLYAYEVLVNRNLNADRTTLGGEAIDLGGFHSFVHDHALKSQVTIRIELDLSSAKLDELWQLPEFLVGTGENSVDLSALGTDAWSGSVSFTVGWADKQRRPFVSKFLVKIDDEKLASLWCESPGSKVLSQVNYRHRIFHWPNARGVSEQTSAGILDELYAPFQSITDQWFWKEGMEFDSDIFDEKADFGIGNLKLLEAPAWPDLRMIENVGAIGTSRWFYRYDTQQQKAILEAALFYAGRDWSQEAAEAEWAKIKTINDKDPFVGVEVLGQEDALPSLDRPLQLLLAMDAKSNEDATEDDIASLLPSNLSSEIRAQIEDRFAKLSSGAAQEARDVIRKLISRLALGSLQVLVTELERFRHIGPLRDIPPRSFRHALTPDASRWSSGLAAWDVLSTAPDQLVNEVSNWLASGQRLGTGYSLVRKRYKELPPDGYIMRILQQENPLDDLPIALEGLANLPEFVRLVLRDENSESGVEIDPPDIAVGITQLVPVVVSTLDKHPGITLIEQPELHNHPSVEVGLGDLFIESMQQKHSRFILETHGEHLMLRILRRIRETSEGELPDGVKGLKPNDVAVYFIARESNGVSATRLRIDETGEFIDKWPNGFFRERGKELF
jgi:hypothetical protein